MSCRGVYFALDESQRDRLLSLDSAEERMDYIQEIEAAWDAPHLQEVDKAWDAIHRCLTGPQPADTLDPDAGSYPLNQAVLGGRSLYDAEDYVISLIEPQAVGDLSAALAQITECAMARRYVKFCKGAWPGYGPEDFAYVWHWFTELRQFLTRIAATGRAVVFTTDQ
jgi:hypothetical protein